MASVDEYHELVRLFTSITSTEVALRDPFAESYVRTATPDSLGASSLRSALISLRTTLNDLLRQEH